MNKKDFYNLINWLFVGLFFVIGILNLFLIHPVPGAFYLLFSLLYLPKTEIIFNRKFNFSIPFRGKVILALIILWGTLAVGDLAELLGL